VIISVRLLRLRRLLGTPSRGARGDNSTRDIVTGRMPSQADVARMTTEVRPTKVQATGPGPEFHLALQVKKLSESAKIPCRGSDGAAGYDLYSAHDCVIPARGKGMVKTDISIAIPYGTYARIAPRSGLAWKNSIDTGAGVVDYDYRGPVGVILFNHSDVDFAVSKGDRVAQMILEKIVTPEILEVEELSDTKRGAGGFGSTGTN